MSWPRPHEGSKTSTRVLLALTALLLLVGAACLVTGLQEHRHPLAGPVPQRPVTAVRSASAPSPTVPMPAAVARSVPVAVRIPAIGLAVWLTELGLNADGTVAVPDQREGARVVLTRPIPRAGRLRGDPGPRGLHSGAGVFFQLRTLQPGDQIEVNLADGVIATFSVTSVAQYQKTAFPDQKVYGSNGSSALQLVTCGGAFDPQTGHYLSNIVVYSSFVSAT